MGEGKRKKTWSYGSRNEAGLEVETAVEQLTYEGPIPTHCPCCEKPDDGTIEIRHRNTAFVDNHLNFMTSCLECWEEDTAYYQERWDDYYAEIYAGIAAGNVWHG